MAKIFLSYRRQDSGGVAWHIYDRLRDHFGEDAVFIDLDSISVGLDFRKQIASAMDKCAVLLAVIGRNWAGEPRPLRRLDDPRDLVRIEVEAALERDLPVIPILIDRATMPGEADLPPSLAPLAYRHAINVDQGPDFHYQVDRLIKGIERFAPRPGPGAAATALPLGRPRAGAPVAGMQEPGSSTLPTDQGHRPAAVPTSKPAVVKLWPPREAGQQPRPKPADMAGAQLDLRGTPAGGITAKEPSKAAASAKRREASATASHPQGAPPTTRRIPWFWLSLGAAPALVVLGIIIQYIPRQPAAGHGGDEQAVSAGPSALANAKPAKSATEDRSSKAAPPPGSGEPAAAKGEPPQPSRQPPPRIVYAVPRHPRAPAPRERTNALGMKFVRIEPGVFLMGSPDPDSDAYGDQKPRHRVQISKAFDLGIHEVTQGQYQAVMGENPSRFKGSDNLPVERVSWLDAVNFCNKLSEREGGKPYYRVQGADVTIDGGSGYRLPTEAEWECACRAGTSTRYSFGDDPAALRDYAWYDANSEAKTHPVGQKHPNAWGLFDMHGSVWEWCFDGYAEDYYNQRVLVDPAGASTTSARLFRGGSWRDEPRNCRSALRNRVPPDYRHDNLGFRLARVQSGR
jgi:formylglycine-generating enzyme required for sulfatase activity